MISRPKKLLIVAVSAAAMVLGTTTAVYGSVAPGTTVTGTSHSLTFKGTINGINITVTCTNFTDSVVVPAGATNKINIPPPTINGCTDSLTGTDTVKTNSTHGSWYLKTNTTGTKLTLGIPEKGATFVSSFLSGCTITAAPTGPVKVKGTYSSSAGTDTVTNKAIAVAGTGCSATSASTTTTVTFSPNPGTIPPFAS
jgi:hypothetical protein